MRILIINKFLHPNGGSEAYIQKLGQLLTDHGHTVQYFGMDHPDRSLGNRVNAYTAPMDFHGSAKLSYAVRTIYSREAREKLRLVLEDFQPEVCHLNNFHYQLTPSILLELQTWQRETGRSCRLLCTAHDYQLVCPNHMCRNPLTGEHCERCLGGGFQSCVRGRCIHGSLGKSLVGALEASVWNASGIYRELDTIICCSRFLKEKLDTNPILAEKTVVLHNFVESHWWKETEKKDYVLYFGRYSPEKGIRTLLRVAEQLPQIPFRFAGTGPLAGEIRGLPNVRELGFQTGEALETLIREARLTVYPSEWYENCPMSVLESLSLGTPVLAADIGGLPELIREGQNGELFESGNPEELQRKLRALWEQPARLARYSARCGAAAVQTAEDYYEAIHRLYSGEERQ